MVHNPLLNHRFCLCYSHSNMLFYNCTNLGSFDYGDTQTKAMPFINSVTSLSSFTTGQSAFYNCTSIKDYNEIPNEWRAK